jgi:hypothetical protein
MTGGNGNKAVSRRELRLHEIESDSRRDSLSGSVES